MSELLRLRSGQVPLRSPKRGGVRGRARCIVPLQDLPRDQTVFRRTPGKCLGFGHG
jgi:hypothetical protein